MIKKFCTLKNKNILITGSSGDLGRALISELIKNGANIICFYNKKLTKEEISFFENKQIIMKVQCNLSNEMQIKKSIHKIRNEKIHFIVNNAANYSAKKFLDLKFNDFLKGYKINFISPFNLMLTIIKRNKNCFCSIVNISSGSGVHGGLMSSYDYSLAKNNFIFLTKLIKNDISLDKIGYVTFIIRFMKSKMLKKYIAIYNNIHKKNKISFSDYKDPEYFAKKIINYIKKINANKKIVKVIT